MPPAALLGFVIRDFASAEFLLDSGWSVGLIEPRIRAE